jgi:hypothetical protein
VTGKLSFGLLNFKDVSSHEDVVEFDYPQNGSPFEIVVSDKYKF